MVKQDSPKMADRRRVLKTTGALVGLSTIPMVTSATPDFNKIYKRSIRLRRKHDWSPERWRRYLKEHTDSDVSINNMKLSKEIGEQNEGEVGTEHIEDPDNLVLDCSLAGNGTYAYADMHFEANDSIYQLGYPPEDGLAMGWDGHEYDFNGDENDGWAGSDESLIDIAEFSGRGVAFEFTDTGHVQEGHWVTVDLLTEGGTPSTRNVIFSYMHTYKDTTIESVSIDTSGVIDITVSDETATWDYPVQDQLFED